MTTFTQFWKIASFRPSFIALISMPQPAIQALRSALEDESWPPGPPEDSGVLAEDWSRARATALTLAAVRDDEGFAPLLGDIELIMRAHPSREQALSAITQLLELDPETEQLNLIKRTQYAALPVLTSLSVEVDFRGIPSVVGGEPTLAPVYVVRLTFDEDIAGSSAVVFQVPDDTTDIVIRRLQEARDMRASITRRLPAQLLNEKIRQEILENGEA